MDLIRADLHLHSTASDGTWLPQELVAAAKQANLGAIAVTDHESVANVEQTEEYALEAGMQFLRGVRCSCEWLRSLPALGAPAPGAGQPCACCRRRRPASAA